MRADRRRQLMTDTVEKVLRSEHADFLRATGALDVLGRGGPRQPA